jgi:hypothetical protein
MTIDITALDTLPESDPVALGDLDGLGLRPCGGKTCGGQTCVFTCFITEW